MRSAEISLFVGSLVPWCLRLSQELRRSWPRLRYRPVAGDRAMATVLQVMGVLEEKKRELKAVQDLKVLP